MEKHTFILPMLQPERQNILEFPNAYNKIATPYTTGADFSKPTRNFLERIQGNLKLRPCKIILVGDVAVGKTTIVHRFCYDKFQYNYKATIGVDFEIENFTILGQNFCLEMWDTAGQERFKCIAQAYYRNANVIIVVFDMSKDETLKSTPTWLKSALAANVNSREKPLIFLVGTKSDLLNKEEFMRVEKSAIKVAECVQAEYWSVSARTGFNVVNFFQRVASLSFEAFIKYAALEKQYIDAT
ncbi:ras-related protein Rab-34, partial [Teleopsis dalmanni]|uniref:ras-related protein Rab-34 n=1 Tax=Teleopsis dalmanni TaxID=139649 RepID=UPI0018CF16E6